MKKNKKAESFHAVEFMRKVREEMNTTFEQDRQGYIDSLKAAMEDFKKKQLQGDQVNKHNG